MNLISKKQLKISKKMSIYFHLLFHQEDQIFGFFIQQQINLIPIHMGFLINSFNNKTNRNEFEKLFFKRVACVCEIGCGYFLILIIFGKGYIYGNTSSNFF